MDMAFTLLTYTVADRIASITLNRPDKRNALNGALVKELQEAFRQAEQDGEVKVVVLKGNGEAFCAGADLEYLQQLQQNTYEENLADSSDLMQLFLQMYRLEKVIIAQVEGHAIAGGCGLMTVCDLSYAVPEAKMGYTEVKIGFIPALVSVFLVRKIGEGKARELLLTGQLIAAQRAAADGLINGVVPATEIQAHVHRIATALCTETSANSLKITKQLIGTVLDISLEDGLGQAARLNATARGHADCKKGIAAFLNKEKPGW